MSPTNHSGRCCQISQAVFRSIPMNHPRRPANLTALALVLFALAPVVTRAASRQTDEIQTSRGPLRVTPIFHGSVMLEFAGKVIHVDPWSQGDYSGIPKADMIVITHTHADHLEKTMIDSLKKPGTLFVG